MIISRDAFAISYDSSYRLNANSNKCNQIKTLNYIGCH